MAQILVLRPDSVNTSELDWIVVTDSGVPIGEPGHGGKAAAVTEAIGRKVIGLVPSVDVLRTRADVPVRGTGKILQALPYALEEQLADDIEELHFAAGERTGDGEVPVAVVRHDKMDSWREQLAAEEIELAAIYTEGDALGDIPGTAVLLAESGRLTLRDIDGTISTGDVENADALIELWLTNQAQPSSDENSEKTPINLLVYATPESHRLLESTIDRVRPALETLDVKILPDGALPRLAAQLATGGGINLLQARYARRSNYRAFWPAWRISAALLAAFCVILIGYTFVENSQLKRQVAALDSAIESAFRYTFPDVRNLQTDLRNQFDAKLKALGRSPRAAAGPGFLDALLSISQAVAGDSGAGSSIQAIDFRGSTVEIRILAPDVEALDRVQKAIAKGGQLQAEIQSANPEGDKVLGRIKITVGA